MTGASHGAAARIMGRRWIVWTVLGVALALLLASSLSVWVKRQALETDNWVEASTQLLQNDEVREAVAVELVDALFSATDVEAQLQEALPSELEALAGPAAGLVYSAALTAAEELLQLPATQALWEEANRRAHERLVAILEGDEDGAVQADDGGVVLDLQELVVRLAEQLGVEVTPSDSEAGQITIVQSDQLAAAQTAVQALEILSVLTFLAVLVLLVLAVALARGFRREALRALALGVTGIGIVLLVVRRLVGEVVVDSLTTASTRESGSAVWAIGTSLLGDLALGLVVFGLVLLAGVVLAGPTRWATALRRGVAPAVRAHPPLIHAVVAGVVLLLLLWGPDAGGRRLFAVLLLAALALTGAEILRRQILRESSSAGDRPGPP